MNNPTATVLPFAKPTVVPIEQLHHHPLNRRVEGLDPEHVNDIASSIEASGFNQTKALTVREVDGGYQIIEGHHRLEAGRQAGLSELPVYIETLTDDEALIKLINGNRQRGNNPLDIGLAALELKSGKASGYARELGVSKQSLSEYTKAASVFDKLSARADSSELSARADSYIGLHRHLNEISKTPEKYWQALANALVTESLSVNVIKARVEKIKSLEAARPSWLTLPNSILSELCGPSKHIQTLTGAYKRASEVYDALIAKPMYRHEATDETVTQDDREYHVMEPIEFDYDPKADFAERLGAESVSINSIDTAERAVLLYMSEHSDDKKKLSPVLTEDEQAEIDRQKAAEEAQALRQHYVPVMHEGDAIDVLRTLDDASIDLAVIDPPYNMDKADWDSYGSGKDFADWCAVWIAEVQRTLKPSGSIYVFGINRMLSHVQHRMDDMGLNFRSWITWDTIQGAGGGLWVNRTEAILYYSKSADAFEDNDAIKLERHEENVREYKGKTYQFKNPSNIWRFPCVDDKSGDRTEHPTQKPIELIERIIKASCPEGGVVLDCFMGSGTTGVAAMSNKRRSIGIEQNPDYVKLAKSRFDIAEVPE